jgi:hypothetical protein
MQQLTQPSFDRNRDPYALEQRRSRFTWKSFLRSTGSLGQRYLRRKVRQLGGD